MKQIGYIAAVILPAVALAFYMYHVAEAKEQAMAKIHAAPPELEVLTDPVTGLEIDPLTNMIMGDGYNTIKKECVRCHPTTLITTYRADTAGWTEAIRWMQAEKGLPEYTPETEATILNYLSAYYGK